MSRPEIDNSMESGRHVLLIGGSGYIGCPVTALLLQKGYRVRNLDLLTYGHQSASMAYMLSENYEFMFGDMGDKATLDQALDGVTDVVILAGLVGDPITKQLPEESRAINDIAMQQCIESLNGRGLGNVIFVSTCSNYGKIPDGEVADEKYALEPLSAYAKSKVNAEKTILSYKGKADYHPTILRFATAFGLAPRMRFDLTVNEFTRDLFLDKELLVFDADTWRPYCHVKDFARLIDTVLQADTAKTSFEVFNAGNNENNFTKQGVVDLICERLPNRTVRYRENSSDPRNYRVNFAKLNKTLDFTCQYSVADGIDEIIAALGQHLFDDVETRKLFYGNYGIAGSPPAPLKRAS